MILKNIKLQDFKNYKDSYLTFNPAMNVIFGDNGNGKTNLLESISLLCYTKSFLQNFEKDCVRNSCNRFDLLGEFENVYNTNSRVGFCYDAENALKKITLDTEGIGKLADFLGRYPLVVLAPQDLRLTSGAPSERRRNFDLLISQFSRLYLGDLRSYNRVIKQKNALLKENVSFRKYSAAELSRLLDVWDHELVEFGSKIIEKRIDFTNEFVNFLTENFRYIVGDSYQPIMEYESEVFGYEGNIRERLSSAVSAMREKEIRRAASLAGPHKDNFAFRFRKEGVLFDVRVFASQGEHKTFVTALKFAEYQYLREKVAGTGTGCPILLLDDIFSDLDKGRISRIIEMLGKYDQFFLTTTDPNYLDRLRERYKKENVSGYHIVNGTAGFVN